MLKLEPNLMLSVSSSSGVPKLEAADHCGRVFSEFRQRFCAGQVDKHDASRDGPLKNGARSGLGYIVRPRDPDRVQLDLNHGLDRSLLIDDNSLTVPLHCVQEIKS